MTWDLFISHASEDKAEIAGPLAEMLQAAGFRVWYDDSTLKLGDNLRRSIEQGLAQSQYGVVVLSPNFFAKKWTNLELDGLFALEKDGENRILPVWHNVTVTDVQSYSGFMASRLGVPTSKGLDYVVQQISRAVNRQNDIGVHDCELSPTFMDSVESVNRRYLSATGLELINSSLIPRGVVPEIMSSISASGPRGALIAAPGGFGKSCVLAQCVTQLAIDGMPYLCVRMDSFTPCLTARQLGEQMDLHASPAVVLAGVADNAPSVLVVDQLDAMSLVSGRNPNLWQAFADLCEDVRRYPRMKMILACRDFDLEHDHRLRSLSDSKSGFARFRLTKLTEREVRASVESAGFGQLALNSRQLEVLAIPFHLLLFLRGNPAQGFNTVDELYDQYWNRKQQNLRTTLGRESHWNEVIDALTTEMSKRQLLLAPALVTDDWASDARAMVSEHVLVEVNGHRQYRFFHESFFDYAYARRFCTKGGNVIDLLASTEQHLFRRAQVRQILTYRRVHDFDQYVADIRGIFESRDVRFHIKRMVASEFNRIDDPRREEWRLLEPYVLGDDLARYVSRALRDHVGWFDLLNSLHVFENWLASRDERLNNAAIWFLEASGLHECRSAEIARLIRPYADRDAEWLQRIQSVMSCGKAHKSVEMTGIYLGLIANGAYDEYESRVSGGDFWSQHYNAEKEAPRFIVDVLATWFDRVVQQFDDGETSWFLDRCRLNHSRIGAKVIGKAAEDEPLYFVEQMLPRFRAAVLRTELSAAGAMSNRIWPSFSNHGEPGKIDEAILLCLRKSLQFLAVQDVEAFRQHASTISGDPHRVFGYLLLRSWADNPLEFANECAEYLAADQRRLNIGYDCTFHSGEGTGENAISRIALTAISSHCSTELLRQLESQIIGFFDKYEAKTPRWRGSSELLLLRSLESSRISERAALRIEELERKFPVLSDAIVREDVSDLIKPVGSPIPADAAGKMSDDQWISAMKKYDGSTDRFEGRTVELSRLLSEFARNDRDRYARLVDKMPDDVNPIYFSAILNGLCSRHVNQRQEEKDADDHRIASFATESFLLVIDRLHALPNRPCGSAIVAAIQRLSERMLPPRILDIASHYATVDPDPTVDAWLEVRGGGNSNSGNPYVHGINTVRGQAALAVEALVFHDHTRFDVLRPVFVALSEDPIICVRTCAINAFTQVLKIDGDTAVHLFLKACEGCMAICATPPFARFAHYAMPTHYVQLRGLLQFALQSEIEDAVQNAARQIILAELSDIDVGTDAADIRTGKENMRKAAVGVYAENLSHEVVGTKCAERLEEFFKDDSEAVRREVSSAFFDLSGERLLELQDMIARFIESPCFEVETDRLLHSLKESNVELPHIICRAAERILEFLGEEGAHIFHHGSMIAHDIATLIVRQYEQTTDDATRTRCLELIDRMERKGYLGIADELAKVDR